MTNGKIIWNLYYKVTMSAIYKETTSKRKITSVPGNALTKDVDIELMEKDK
jgi:hypothetical protein